MSEWISVNDRLPEHDHCYVLFASQGGHVSSTFYSVDRAGLKRFGNSYSRSTQGKNSGFFEASHQYGYKVTHWMPLPSPPEDSQ